MPALDLKCITKLKAMQQRATAAFEGCLSHVDQKWKSSDFWNLPCSIAGQWGHVSMNSSAFFSIHMMSNGQSGFCVSKAKKICSWLVTAFVPDSRHRTLPAQWYLRRKHVALCSQYPHCLPYPPHPSCPGEVIWRCVKVSDTDLQQSEKISAQLGSSLLTLVSSLFAEVQITRESWGKKTCFSPKSFWKKNLNATL